MNNLAAATILVPASYKAGISHIISCPPYEVAAAMWVAGIVVIKN
jgi:hypothetical protein